MPVIKRYPNRKLYDTETKRYVTLNDIAALIREGQEVQVVDHATEEDLTAITLTQIIFEQEKQQGGFLPKSVLTGLVRAGGDTMNSLRRGLTLPLDLLHYVDTEIERRLQALINKGELAKEEGLRLRDKLLSPASRLSSSILPGSEDVDKLLNERGIPSRKELDRLNAQLEELSARLDSMIQQTEPEAEPSDQSNQLIPSD
jgi:polyhydroxyalkanoate synthesis repressor PhaR